VEKATDGSGLRWPGPGRPSRRELILRVMRQNAALGDISICSETFRKLSHGGPASSPIISAGVCSRLGPASAGAPAFRNLNACESCENASPL